MRTTLNIDDSLLRRAAKLTGVNEKTSLVRLGLEALVARESARRLANLGGPRSDSGPFEGAASAGPHDSRGHFGVDRAPPKGEQASSVFAL